jgi:hypothetical protein
LGILAETLQGGLRELLHHGVLRYMERFFSENVQALMGSREPFTVKEVARGLENSSGLSELCGPALYLLQPVTLKTLPRVCESRRVAS